MLLIDPVQWSLTCNVRYPTSWNEDNVRLLSTFITSICSDDPTIPRNRTKVFTVNIYKSMNKKDSGHEYGIARYAC